MAFEWTIPKIFSDNPERKYINPCCIGGDELLGQIKSEIASRMDIDEKRINIYQEDWGWAMEFSKDDVFYFLGISNNEASEKETIFSVNFEATRKVKKFLFTKSVEAADKQNGFNEIILKIAEIKGFKFT